MQTLSEIRALLAARGLRPRLSAGQHFLHDKNLLTTLVDAAAVGPGDLVLEVGPGTGTLTEALLDRGAEVVACEVDRGLADVVAERLGDRVRLVRDDCLRGRALSPALVDALAGRPFALVANLPFQVAGTLIGVLLLDRPECRGMFVTIQKEVARRLTATPGRREYGPLSVTVQVMAVVRRIAEVPASCFWPVPAVAATICAIVRRPDHGLEDPAAFSRFVGRLFQGRRKQLKRILAEAPERWPAGVRGDLRPEALDPARLVALWRAVER